MSKLSLLQILTQHVSTLTWGNLKGLCTKLFIRFRLQYYVFNLALTVNTVTFKRKNQAKNMLLIGQTEYFKILYIYTIL
jgi:hypothetical protein